MAAIRSLRSGRWAHVLALVAVAAASFHLLTASTGLLEARLQRSIHFLFMLPLAFILYPARESSPKEAPAWSDLALALAAVLVNVYIIVNASRLQARWEGITPVLPEELVLGALAAMLCLEAVRRATTFALAAVTSVFLIYLYWSDAAYGASGGALATLRRVVETLYLFRSEGIYGGLLGVSATYIAIFVLFSSLVARSGIGDLFIGLASLLAGRARGATAKMAVVSSALFGTVAGQGTANVYATGTFTIPLMKKAGYPGAFAAGVEAVSSMGGALLPPVMGTAAFVMAEMIGLPLTTIMWRALVPALLYFAGVLLVVHFHAGKEELGPTTALDDETPRPELGAVLSKSYALAPIVVLLVTLLLGFSALRAGLFAIVSSLPLVAVRARGGEQNLIQVLLEILISALRNTVMIAVTCACAGMIVAAIAHSGLAITFGVKVASLTGGLMPVALAITMCVAVILGMGLPATPAYVLTASLLMPSLSLLNLDPILAHLFVFYFAILACITPPVCLCSYAAAGLAQADPMRTGLEGLRAGFAGFLVPFAFIYRPALTLQGSWGDVLVAVSLTLISVGAMAASLTGWVSAPLRLWERGLLLAGAVALVYPALPSILIGLAAIMTVVIARSPRAAASRPSSTADDSNWREPP